MAEKLHLVLALHQHQPPGNSDAVVERCYQQSYDPLVSLLTRYPEVRVSLHTSGCLYDWIEAHSPDYLDRLSRLAATGQIDVLGGAYSDPILPALPREDRIAQIVRYGERLSQRFGYRPRGMWIAERVWEPCLASDLAAAGIEHTVLDDTHFFNAGLTEEHLHGYWLTDDNSPPVALFAGSQRLRYMIPYAEPEEVIATLRQIWQANPGGVVVYADDGEKFGAWPGMFEHCHERGWLARFFEALSAQTDWLRVSTMREVVDQVPPLGKVYVPDSSYREMNAWAALAVDHKPDADQMHLDERDAGKTDCETAALVGYDNQPSRTSVRGTWRNFRVKYPAVDEMQARMLMVSRRLRDVHGHAAADERLLAARHELDLAQCGCAYWHGVYGGAYLPHLRHAVYRHLIAADGLIDAALGKTSPWVEATLDDWNSDVHKEVSLANEHVHAIIAPERGGMLYELDVREAGVNLLATFARRSESYHDVTRVASASGRKEPLPDRNPQMIYDDHPRKSLIDHFFAATTSLAEVVDGTAEEQGDFVQGRYHRRLRRHADRIELVLSRTGWVDGRKLSLTKTVVLAEGASELEIRYELEGLPPRATHFGIEFNVATLGVASQDGAQEIDDRGELLCNERGATIGDLAQELDLAPVSGLSIVSRQRGVEWKLRTSREAAFWTYPIRTLSRCQEGQEWIQQSIVIMPHWQVNADARGRWQVDLTMAVSALTAATV